MSESSTPIRYEATASFVQLLEVTGCSLSVSVYMQGRVVLVGADKDALRIGSFPFPRLMGISTTTIDGELHTVVATLSVMGPQWVGGSDVIRTHTSYPRSPALCVGAVETTRSSREATLEGRHLIMPRHARAPLCGPKTSSVNNLDKIPCSLKKIPYSP